MMPLTPMLGRGQRRKLHASGDAKRERLLAAIQAQPGLTFRGVCRASGVQTGTATHHLATLRGLGLVVAFEHGDSTRYFPAAWTPVAAAVAVVRSDPTLRLLLDALGAERLCQKALIERLPDVPRSTVQHALARLVRVGAVGVQRQGRLSFYGVA
jgi:predicted transcriptional regulator